MSVLCSSQASVSDSNKNSRYLVSREILCPTTVPTCCRVVTDLWEKDEALCAIPGGTELALACVLSSFC